MKYVLEHDEVQNLIAQALLDRYFPKASGENTLCFNFKMSSRGVCTLTFELKEKK